MSENSKSSPWVWLSLVVIVGSFSAFILYLDQKVVTSGQQAHESPPLDGEVSEPVIDFYTVLQDRQFDVPVPASPQPDPTASGASLPSAEGGRYILQAGSFRKAPDADRRKAELALLGLEAAIRKAEIDGLTYHRVEIGPFSDDGFYSQVKNRLISNDIAFIAKSAD